MTKYPVYAFSLVVGLTLVACSRPSAESGAPPSPSAVASNAKAPTSGAAALVRVANPAEVCMVNDQYMGQPQIPVQVADKTYYGCCAMCKEKLEKQEAARTAIDPVTGKRVDKSVAVIGKNEKGKVFYFESEATLAQYKP